MNYIHIIDEDYSIVDIENNKEYKCFSCDLYKSHCADDQCHLCAAFEYTFCLRNVIFKKLKIHN